MSVSTTSSKYIEGYKYGFLVKDARMFKESIPYSGELRFFNVDDSIIIEYTLINS